MNDFLTVQRLGQTALSPFILMMASSLRQPLLEKSTDPGQVVLGASFWGQPAGVAVLHAEKGVAILTDLYVLPAYRRAGIGSALLAAAEEEVKRSGLGKIQAVYRADEHTPAFEHLLANQGWAPPLVQSVVFWTSCSAGYDEWSQRYRFRPPYAAVPWSEISEAERQVIASRGASGWYPPKFSPFQRPSHVWDEETSLGLRYKGEVVGWLLTLREAPDLIRVEIMFVDPPLQRLGRGILLICEMIRRYCHDGDYHDSPNEHCYWRVSPDNEGMLRWSRRSFPGRFTDVYDEWYSKKSLLPCSPNG